MATNDTDQTDNEVKAILALSVIVGIVWWLVMEIFLFAISFHPGTGITRLFVTIIFFTVVFTFISHIEEDSILEKENSNQKTPSSNSQHTSTSRERATVQSTSQPPRIISDLSDAIQISKHIGDNPSGRNTLKEKLQSMDEYAFENLVADLWENVGWDTSVTSGSGDRGIDIVATRTGMTTEKQAIQAKRYSEGNSVGSQDVRNYATLYQQEPDVDSVVIVTTSRFTKQATRLAKDLNVKLVDGDSLCQRISQVARQDAQNKLSGDEMVEGIFKSVHRESSVTGLTKPSNGMTDNQGNDLKKMVEEFEGVLLIFQEHNESHLLTPVLNYITFLRQASENNTINEREFRSRVLDIKNGIENESDRLRTLNSLPFPNKFPEVNRAMDSYIQCHRELVETTISIYNKGMENVDEDDLWKIDSKAEKIPAVEKELKSKIGTAVNNLDKDIESERPDSTNQYL
jgi:HJR/Mrr/RecB family endonuclease